ncbi:hypothetical protein, partial [Saccharococcus thermophilus]|uniref:hypothetical protein n=1 Tax=Saccharococcus thermophilus TaxID=29396 RepID=UPI003620E4BE
GILLLDIGRVLLSLRFLVQSENTLPFFFCSSKMLYTNFYTSSLFPNPQKSKDVAGTERAAFRFLGKY